MAENIYDHYENILALDTLYDVCKYARNPARKLSDIDEIILFIVYIYKRGNTILCKIVEDDTISNEFY
jgi:hypothetical protein